MVNQAYLKQLKKDYLTKSENNVKTYFPEYSIKNITETLSGYVHDKELDIKEFK